MVVIRYYAMKNKLEEFRGIAKQNKIVPVAIVRQTEKGFLDADGKLYKSLDDIQAKVKIVDDIPETKGGVLVGETSDG